MKNDISFVPSNLKEMWREWLSPLRYHEISLIVSYPGNDNIRRLDQLVENHSFVKFFLDIENEVEWVQLDYRVDSLAMIDLLNRTIEKGGDNKTTIILIRGFEDILRDGRKDIVMAIQGLYRHPNKRIMLVSENNYYDPEFEKVVLSLPSFQPRLVYLPTYQEKQVSEFIGYLFDKWEIQANERIRSEIFANCGGSLGLVKEVVWCLRDSETKTISEALNSQRLLWQIKSWWSKLSNEDQQYLRYLAFGLIPDHISPMTKDYLRRMRIVGEENTILARQVLEYVLQYEQNPKHISLNGNQLLIAGVDYFSYFTTKQRMILHVLISHKNSIISREKIIRETWTESDDGGSDWAFDSQVNRLRKRLKTLGIGERHLVTKKGKGLLWQE